MEKDIETKGVETKDAKSEESRSCTLGEKIIMCAMTFTMFAVVLCVCYCAYESIMQKKQMKDEFNTYIEQGYSVYLPSGVLIDDWCPDDILDSVDALGYNHEKKEVYLVEFE